MPRLGFAYSPEYFKHRFVVRGGYGITNFMEGTGANYRLTLNPPFYTDADENFGATGRYYSVTGGFPVPANAASLAGEIRAWDPHIKPALIQQYNLTTETQLFSQTSLTIAYLGQNGQHLADLREGNQQACPTCPLPISSLPGLQNVTNLDYVESEAGMNYNSLQITGRQQLSKGLEFLANWTYSKSLTNSLGFYGAGGGASGSNYAKYWQNAYNPGADYGPAFFDSRHVFSFSGVYDLPFGRGRMFGSGMNYALNEVAGGWKLSVVSTLHTGFPVTIFSNQYYQVNSQTTRANHYRLLHIVHRSVNNWFGTDPSAVPCQTSGEDNGLCAYGAESSTSFGTAGVGTEESPGFKDVDAALSKTFEIKNGLNFDFRADFFNVLNTTSLSPPSNSVSSSSFGLISGTVSTERQIQLAGKLVF